VQKELEKGASRQSCKEGDYLEVVWEFIVDIFEQVEHIGLIFFSVSAFNFKDFLESKDFIAKSFNQILVLFFSVMDKGVFRYG
jgi:hypothetical protein